MAHRQNAGRPDTPSLLMLCMLAMLQISGCSISWKYIVRGTIRDVDSDAPIAGVTITLDGDYVVTSDPSATNVDGIFVLNFSSSPFPVSTSPKWTLVLRKAGFVDQKVDISPTKEPTSRDPSLIAVAAYMKPAP